MLYLFKTFYIKSNFSRKLLLFLRHVFMKSLGQHVSHKFIEKVFEDAKKLHDYTARNMNSSCHCNNIQSKLKCFLDFLYEQKFVVIFLFNKIIED